MSNNVFKPTYYILNKDHSIIATHDVNVWGKFFEDFNNRRVAHDTLAGFEISTVFLGLDHRFVASSSPALFETMVFKEGRKDHMEVWVDRCSTWEEAEHMHRRALAWVGCCAPFAVKENEDEDTQDKV